MSRFVRFAPALVSLAATFAVMPSIALAGSYWDTLKWQARPLVLVEGDSSTANWADRLLNDRCALAERRIHWLVIEEDGAVWRRFDGGETAASSVRDRVGWSRGDDTRLMLFGLDGQRKYSGRPDGLETIWALIDRMPMRRNELAREPDDCDGP